MLSNQKIISVLHNKVVQSKPTNESVALWKPGCQVCIWIIINGNVHVAKLVLKQVLTFGGDVHEGGDPQAVQEFQIGGVLEIPQVHEWQDLHRSLLLTQQSTSYEMFLLLKKLFQLFDKCFNF